MVTGILIILFIGAAIVCFSNIIAINKIAGKCLFASHNMLTKSDWRQIGKHFLHIIAAVVAFFILVLVLYFFGFWSDKGFHFYY